MENKITILNQKNCGLSIRPFILVKIFDFYGRPSGKFLKNRT
jgi:hypothetical protein